MSSLKNTAIKGASWSLAGKILQQGTQFIIGIVLARLLTPEEYGLVAMATIFIFISYVFVDSGFSAALVQKKTCTKADYSTVFYVNLGVSLIAFLGFYLTAPLIADFYNEPQLIDVLRVLSLIIIFYAITIVQNSIIIRDVNFKLKTRIEFISQVLSGSIGIYLAFKGMGVWAIIWKTLLNQVFVNIQLWLKNNWIPSFEFSKKSFSELFSFSSKLLISQILDRVYQQLNRLVVGKFFPVKELGLYTRAEQFQNLPSHSITSALMSFLLPVFSKMQDEPERMKNAAKKVLKIVMFLNINAMVLMGIIAGPLITVLLGEIWVGSIPYLQLMVFVALFYPMHSINVQILAALGRTDLYLKIELIKKIVGMPAILIGIFVGIKAMIIGMIGSSIIALFVNTYYTNKLINFGFFEQIKSITNSFIISVLMAIILYPVVYFLTPTISQVILLFIITILGVLIVIMFSKMIKMAEYYEIKSFVFKLINKHEDNN